MRTRVCEDEATGFERFLADHAAEPLTESSVGVRVISIARLQFDYDSLLWREREIRSLYSRFFTPRPDIGILDTIPRKN